MKLFNKVAIVGVGLIGGSLGLRLKKLGLVNQVIGVSRHKNTITFAKKIGAIDDGALDLSIIKDADLVILALPVSKIIARAGEIARVIRKDAIVMDVGSTKEEIVLKLEKIFANFVGTHPLAGSEKRGIANVGEDIFKNSLCLITPTKYTSRIALNKVKKLFSCLGSRTVSLSPAIHDQILSFTSHLAHAVAFSLINAIPKKDLKFASTGLRDTTRIAASEAGLWSDIFLSNQKNVLRAIKNFQRSLDKIKSAIRSKNQRQLTLILKKAKKTKQTLG